MLKTTTNQNILYQVAKMGKIALKTLSFELGYFMIGILWVCSKEVKSGNFVDKRFEKYGTNMGPVSRSIKGKRSINLSLNLCFLSLYLYLYLCLYTRRVCKSSANSAIVTLGLGPRFLRQICTELF